MNERQVDVAIIGAGSAGLYALGQVRRSGKSFVLINGGELGTTCARVGCMPSKAIVQVAEDFHRRRHFDRYGVEGHEDMGLSLPEAMEYVQNLRDTFVERVISNSTDTLGDAFLDGYATFLEPGLLDVEGQRIRAGRVIIATGSRPVVPAAWDAFRDRVLTTDDLFDQEDLPASIAARATSGSLMPPMVCARSTPVTSTPILCSAWPSSSPMAPRPKTAIEAGRSS